MEQYLILGALQGMTEWLPISSEGALFLASEMLFGARDIHDLLSQVVFLHLGTAAAALIYFQKDVRHLVLGFFRYPRQNGETKALIRFLLLASAITGVTGLVLLGFLQAMPSGQVLMAFIGGLLVFTGLVQLLGRKNKGVKRTADLSVADSLLLGLAQGFAILPGISRSGITVSALLLRGFDDASALRISFLMSIPAILGANVFLNWNAVSFGREGLVGLAASFLAGLLTIHILLRVARKLPFGWFVLGFGALVVVFAAVS